MRKTLFLSAILATAVGQGPQQAQETGASDLTELIRPIRQRHAVPGLVAALIVNDRVVATAADGVRQRGSAAAITVHDKMHIGSCTKAMTATLMAILVDEGKLSWSTTVGEVFADLGDRMHADWKGVTIEQLLTNRGGAPASLDADGLWARLWQLNHSPSKARQALIEGVLRSPPLYEPGTQFVYSNAGFALAGAMAEHACGQPWETLMRDKVFVPLGMHSAGFGAPGSGETLDQPRGHTAAGTPKQPGPGADNPVAIGPAGIVHCSMLDWAKFIAAHLLASRGECRLVSCDSYKKMHTAPPGHEYALGWGVTTRGWAKGVDESKDQQFTGTVLTHAGSNTLWYSVAWLAPERQFAVIVACNQGGDVAAKACDDVAAKLIEHHLTTVP